jgi:hypothetical protein
VTAGRCRICGCTDAAACPVGCSWVQADLCSVCADVELAIVALFQPRKLSEIVREVLVRLDDLVEEGSCDAPRVRRAVRDLFDQGALTRGGRPRAPTYALAGAVEGAERVEVARHAGVRPRDRAEAREGTGPDARPLRPLPVVPGPPGALPPRKITLTGISYGIACSPLGVTLYREESRKVGAGWARLVCDLAEALGDEIVKRGGGASPAVEDASLPAAPAPAPEKEAANVG